MVVGLSGAALYHYTDKFHLPTAVSALVLLILVVFAFALNSSFIRKGFEPLDEGVFVGEHKFVFDAKGIQSKGKGYEGLHEWSVVKRIEYVPNMILIYLDAAYAFIFPVAKLDNPDGFYEFIVEQYSKSMGESGGG